MPFEEKGSSTKILAECLVSACTERPVEERSEGSGSIISLRRPGESIILTAMQTCPYCKDFVGQDAVRCPACDASHHMECWQANARNCSVFGCESTPDENLLGCPWCEEVYPADRAHCMVCNTTLMTPQIYLEFLNRYEWVELPPADDESPLLTAGYLRNHGLVVRLEKRAPISMFGLRQPARLWVSNQDAEQARRLLEDLKENFTRCIICGHVISREDQDCSFCLESPGEET